MRGFIFGKDKKCPNLFKRLETDPSKLRLPLYMVYGGFESTPLLLLLLGSNSLICNFFLVKTRRTSFLII